MGYPPPPEDNSVSSIKKNLEDARQYDAAGPWGKVNIYRVPHCLRDTKRKKAYIPQVVSLGPYHHGRTHLQPMELHKWRALQNILKRKNQNVELYLYSMKELEERARACYEGQLKLSSNKFAEMMMLDGCFVLELFLGYALWFEELGYASNDPVFSMKGKIQSIRREMIMLENQIPLTVLSKLLELQLPDDMKDRSEHEVAQQAIHFLAPLMQTGRDHRKYDPQSDLVGLHCLDVFRKYLLSKGPDNVQSSTRDSSTSDPPSDKVGLHCLDVLKKYILYKGSDNVQSSTRDSTTSDPQSDEVGLHCLDVSKKYLSYKGPDNVHSSTRDSTTSDPQSAKVGLHCLDVFRKSLLYKGPDHFRRKRSHNDHEADNRRQQLIHCVTDLKDSGINFKKHTSTDRLWDIQFNNGVLYIPPIWIDDSTESLLRNLIAYEQCHLDCKKDITDYVAFLDDLINSEEDVRYLRRHKIIENWLGSDLEVADLVNSLCQEVISGHTYSKLYEEINEHYDRKWNIWRSTLKRKYFSNPWAILSLVAAVFLLLMTAAQTFYTVYPYYMPRKPAS